MRIGIFGGSFNPPHNMHKNIALNLIEKEYLDKIIYVPTGDNYNKKDLINFNDRYKMIELMIKDYDNLSISNIGNDDKYKYTYQALDYFKNIYPNDDIYFICGSDNLVEFNTWMNYKYILDNYKLLIIGRDNLNIKDLIYGNVILTTIKQEDISSTNIRNLIKQKKYQELNKVLNKNIINYIRERGLYGNKN